MPEHDSLELFRLRVEYPPGTPCWYSESGSTKTPQQGWVADWEWRDGTPHVQLAGGGSAPLDQLLFEDPVTVRRGWSADATQSELTQRGASSGR